MYSKGAHVPEREPCARRGAMCPKGTMFLKRANVPEGGPCARRGPMFSKGALVPDGANVTEGGHVLEGGPMSSKGAMRIWTLACVPRVLKTSPAVRGPIGSLFNS